MEIRAAGRPGRPNAKEITKIKEDKPSNKNNDQATSQMKTGINKTNPNQQEHSNHIKNKDQEQNQHLAWNPDSWWSR